MTPIRLTPEQAASRLIRRADLVPCRVAFIDCKMPGSTLKENYSLIGPGVTQSENQVVNLTEPHGFSLGVAAMPPGTVNNLHIHFTAEVFMVFRGRWRFRWGADGQDGEIEAVPGDVISMPTWIFRGFTCIGEEPGWIFTALGGDDTGGIIWHPSILRTAAEHGLYLTRENLLVDTEAGAPVPPADSLIEPLGEDAIASLRRWSAAEMQGRVVAAATRRWSSRALLDAALPGHESRLAPVIGYGMTEDRDHEAPIGNPHGFSVEWIAIPPGQAIGRHLLAEKQVLIAFRGAATVTLNDPAAAIPLTLSAQESISVPGDVWRAIAAGPEGVELAAITAGDGRKHVTWAPEIVATAAEHGIGLDHNGYVAPLALLPPRRAA